MKRNLALTLAAALLVLADVSSAHARYALPMAPSDYTITSWFDHTSPQYDGDSNSATMTRYDGATGYSYNGHNGIDYGASEGKDVLAAASGTVRAVQWQNPNNHGEGYGYMVRIWHATHSNSTLYGHLQSNSQQAGVSVGASVSAGQVVAKSGNTGNSTGPHLHFSVFAGDVSTTNSSIDPYGWSGSGSDPWSTNQGYLWNTNPPSLSSAPPVPYATTVMSPTGRRFKVGTTFSWTNAGMDNSQPAAHFILKIWKSLNGTRFGSAIHDAQVNGTSSTVTLPHAGEYQFMVIAYNGLTGSSERHTDSAYTTFHIVDQFDYDRNGTSDILWRNQSTGSNTIWSMSGPSFVGSNAIDAVTDVNWEIAATADYNRDGYVDILWQNRTTGSATWWAMSGTTHVGSDAVASGISSDWKIVGAPDYDGDNLPDLLWRNTSTGANTYWKMSGASHVGSDSVAAVTDVNWEIVGTPNYDNSGSTDILWRNKSTGSNTYWSMSGPSHLGSDSVEAITDTNWEIVGTPDYDADGATDILLRHKSTGSNTFWKMGGATHVGSDGVTAVTDTNWRIRAVR